MDSRQSFPESTAPRKQANQEKAKAFKDLVSSPGFDYFCQLADSNLGAHGLSNAIIPKSWADIPRYLFSCVARDAFAEIVRDARAKASEYKGE